MEEKKKVGGGFGVLLLRDGKVLLGKRHDDPIKADSALQNLNSEKLLNRVRFAKCERRQVFFLGG
jgi:hypothetical protein